MPTLVKKLNLVLRGWGHYHRPVVASETFACIDKYVREQLWRMLRHRHPKKSKPELFRKYWTDEGGRHIFTVRQNTAKGPRVYTVMRLGALPSGRYIKVPKGANPYQPEYARLFWERRHKKERWMMSCLSARQYRAQRAGG
jgi:RNA-directed DNA polymerase